MHRPPTPPPQQVGAELESFFDDEWGGLDVTARDPLSCNSVLTCFELVLYKAMPGGDMSAVLDDVDRTGSKFTTRVLFDLSFFIWVGILLFNVVTGLIVDTFSLLREEALARDDQLENGGWEGGGTWPGGCDRDPLAAFDGTTNHALTVTLTLTHTRPSASPRMFCVWVHTPCLRRPWYRV